jgi:hypothetical protein
LARFSLFGEIGAGTEKPRRRRPAAPREKIRGPIKPSTAPGRLAELSAIWNERLSRCQPPAPPHPDAQLLAELLAMNTLWRREINAWIALKKLNTRAAAVRVHRAREATAAIVDRIDTFPAVTWEGMEVKRYAHIWRDHGPPGDIL